ncbi:hypothetical protein CRE_23147 [Caenorhabditis remanei]|uniref:Uncharacterized protein n=1 Tax=Caenorhabditis remanei TaxID=31234 RepID=E3NFW4_CAERE|nr:hypothetical protein CRE_23147 [Caenorhabditis remanei]
MILAPQAPQTSSTPQAPQRIADLKRHYRVHFKKAPKEFVTEWGKLKETARKQCSHSSNNDPLSTAVAIENEEEDGMQRWFQLVLRESATPELLQKIKI